MINARFTTIENGNLAMRGDYSKAIFPGHPEYDNARFEIKFLPNSDPRLKAIPAMRFDKTLTRRAFKESLERKTVRVKSQLP